MRDTVAWIMEAAGFALIIACAYVLLGPGAAFGVAGAGLVLAGAVIAR